MKLRQPSLFDDQRMGFSDAQAMSVQALLAFAQSHRHWAIAYSGGKDSSATVSFIVWLITTGQIPAPLSLTVLYADTRMELPPLQAAALAMLAELRKRGIDARVVYPAMDDRFFVYMFGRGVPPPSNTFRWCTPQLKVEPMLAALKELRDRVGEKLLMITGVRLGESAARDSRIALSCGRNGAECGQGWFQEATPDAIADTLAPMLHWRVCFVWDWLKVFAPAEGFPTQMVADSYGGDEAEEVNARTGCVGCNLASRDVALETILKLERWEYLRPLTELRGVYAELKKPNMRLRKWDERKADGTMVSNPGRMGPLTMDARRWGLSAILDIQARCNGAANGRPIIDLINIEEKARILELIAANTWPQRWTGEEMRADTPTDDIRRDGSIQKVMLNVLEEAV
jgi:DNA sulfur modification protein DndC